MTEPRVSGLNAGSDESLHSALRQVNDRSLEEHDRVYLIAMVLCSSHGANLKEVTRRPDVLMDNCPVRMGDCTWLRYLHREVIDRLRHRHQLRLVGS